MSEVLMKGDYSGLHGEEKEFVMKKMKKFSEKYETNLSNVHIKLDCEKHRESHKGKKSFQCKIAADIKEGMFNADNTDFGEAKAIVGALEKIDRQIATKKAKF